MKTLEIITKNGSVGLGQFDDIKNKNCRFEIKSTRKDNISTKLYYYSQDEQRQKDIDWILDDFSIVNSEKTMVDERITIEIEYQMNNIRRQEENEWLEEFEEIKTRY